jgi:hypothetical protein
MSLVLSIFGYLFGSSRISRKSLGDCTARLASPTAVTPPSSLHMSQLRKCLLHRLHTVKLQGKKLYLCHAMNTSTFQYMTPT